MQESALVIVVTDGRVYWTEIYGANIDQSTFARHVEQNRWTSMFEAKSKSPWWPAGELGNSPSPEHERMHRALCSWSNCTHQVVWVADSPALVA